MTLRVYLDTNVFVHAFENAGSTASHACDLLELIGAGRARAVISELVVAELLVKPLSQGDQDLADAYAKLFHSPPGFEICPIDREILTEAATQRARQKAAKLPDAIHIATARFRGCAAFVSQDQRLELPRGLIPIRLDASTRDRLLELT